MAEHPMEPQAFDMLTSVYKQKTEKQLKSMFRQITKLWLVWNEAKDDNKIFMMEDRKTVQQFIKSTLRK